MPAILFAEIDNGNAAHTIDDLIKKFDGGAARSCGRAVIASFAGGARALECALAVQSRIAAENRARKSGEPAAMRLFVDQIEHGAPNAEDVGLQRASSIGAAASGGRVLVSRPIYLQARSTRLFAFIPLGEQRFAGCTDPVEVFEAISVAGRAWTERTPAAVPLEVLDTPSDATLEPRLFRPSLGAWALIAIATSVLFGAHRVSWMLLSPLHLFDVLFYVAGASLFGSSGSESAAALGGLMMPLAMPLVAVVCFIHQRRLSAARLSILWLAESLMSVGESVLRPPQAESFAAAQLAGFVDSLSAVGAAAFAPRLAQLAVFTGCLLTAFAVISAFGRRGRTQ